MTTQTEITQRNRFFWGLLIGATMVSLIGNVAHAVLPYVPGVIIQIGAAAVPPIALLAAVHGVALAVRGGASGRVYCWAVGVVAAIGVGAFAVSFVALRNLMLAIGYSSATAWVFPAIIDTAVAMSTIMLVALGDKPARRTRAVTTAANTRGSIGQPPRQDAKCAVTPVAPTRGCTQPAQGKQAQRRASIQRGPVQTMQRIAQTEVAGAYADLASKLIASGVTTQPVETVIAVLAATREGASINAAAKASGINYRTAQRIVDGAERRQWQLVAVC